MKTRYRLILLFILVFAGVALLASKPARADWNRTCDSVLDGECFTVPATEPPIWTLKVFVGCEECPDGSYITCNDASYCETSNEIPVSGNWPIPDPDNNRVIFRYITGVYEPGVTKVNTQSYTVFQWPYMPLGADPSGAQADVDLYEACGATIPDYAIGYKLNKLASDKTDGVLDIYMPVGTDVDKLCGSAWIKWAKECGGDRIWTAKTLMEPLTSPRTFPKCGDTTVTMYFDECTRAPITDQVYCGSDTAEYVPDGILCRANADGTVSDNCVTDPNAGPRSGVVICSVPPDPPVIVWGRDMWFCPR